MSVLKKLHPLKVKSVDNTRSYVTLLDLKWPPVTVLSLRPVEKFDKSSKAGEGWGEY